MRINTKLANALNTMYQGIVNKNATVEINSREYVEASQFVDEYYPKLKEGVLEYLAAYMIVHPEGKIQFMPAKQNAVDLSCRHDDYLKVISYNDDGVIIKDEEAKVVQKGE